MAKKPKEWLKKLIGTPGISIDDQLFTMDSKTLDQQASPMHKPSILLDRFRQDDVMGILKKLNIIDKLEKSGFTDIILDIDIRSYLDQRINIFYDIRDRQHLLIEIRMTNGDGRRQVKHTINKREYSFLLIEWLVMQNPKISLWEKGRRFPGQDFPGLPMGYALIDFFQLIARKLELDGLLCLPEFFHNAYSRYFYFAEHQKQAEFLSVLRDLCLSDIDRLSNLIESKAVLSVDNKTYEWISKEMVMPISRELFDYFNSDRYIKMVQETMKGYRYKEK